MLQVFVVFSNHLDVGYTDNLDGSCAGAVVNRYFDDHFPNAIKTADEFRQVRNLCAYVIVLAHGHLHAPTPQAGNPNRTYAWMTQSWLVQVPETSRNILTNGMCDLIRNGVHAGVSPLCQHHHQYLRRRRAKHAALVP